jgi:hypothetical protein
MIRACFRRAIAPCLVVLAGCSATGGTSGDGPSTTDTPASTSIAATTPASKASTNPAEKAATASACQLIEGQGDVYNLLVRLARDGSLPPAESAKLTPEVFANIALSADKYVTEQPEPQLTLDVNAVDIGAADVHAQITSGQPINPIPLRDALQQAAGTCEKDGYAISWN